MFDEPEEQPAERHLSPADRAKEKADEFRMHAELFAVFEGGRKFDAQVVAGLEAGLARQIQQTIGRLEKSRSPESPVLPAQSAEAAAGLLGMPQSRGISTNDYHVCRRPGEVTIVRFLQGEQVETFYERAQAHIDAALGVFREEERHTHQWKQDPQMLAYLEALDAIKMPMAERYLRQPIRQHQLFVLSTQAADEMNIAYLTDYIMGIAPAELVGPAAAPPDQPNEQDLAWFFKLFFLRGMHDGEEAICFFTYLQKSDDTF